MTPPGDNIVFDLDTAFAGVDERSDAGAVPGSSEVQNGARVAEAQNVRFTGRRIETRPAYRFSSRYNPPGRQGVTDATWNAGKMTGTGTYVDPNTGIEYLLLCRQFAALNPYRRVYLCREDAGPVYVAAGAMDAFVSASREQDLVRFTQLGGDVVMWQRNGEAPRLWDGTLGGEFLPVADVEPVLEAGPSYEPLPAAEFGIAAADRLVFPYEGGIGYTDILEARRWDPSSAYVQIGDDGGPVTGLFWWRGNSLLVFKRASVWIVENFSGNLSQLAVRNAPLTRQAGCVAPDTITELAEDVVFLGQGGVHSVSKLLQAEDKALNAVPVSWLIPRTMARINWSRAHLSSAVLSRETWVLAVPVDSADMPSLLVVMNATNAEWQGNDVPGGAYGAGEYLGLRRCRLYGRETWSVVRRHDVLTAGWGWMDRGDDTSSGDIATRVRFRGYHAQEHGKTRWVRVEVETEELGTENVTLTAYGDGSRTEIPLQGATTRDRTRWLAYGRVTRSPDNSDDDFDAPGREDYAPVIETGGIETGSGITLEILQGHTLAGNATGRMRTIAPVVSCTAGKLWINVLRAAGVK